jgi:hypothetical protein
MIRCVDPAVGEALLDRVRPGDPELDPRELAHLEACAGCRASVERVRRMAEAWRALEPTAAELRSARGRFARSPPGRRGSPKMVPRAAALVIVLAAAAAGAAVRVVVHFASPTPAPTALSAPEVAAPTAKARRKGHGLAARPAGPLDPAVDDALDVPAPTESPEAGIAQAPPPAEVPVDALPQAPPLPPSPPPTSAPAVVRHAVTAPPAPQAVSQEPPSRTDGPAPSPWVVAAAAMRSGDYGAAEAAFNQLARSPDPSTRDAARLARAQVLVARGRVAEARPELRDLSIDGATPLVRKRAAEALDALP